MGLNAEGARTADGFDRQTQLLACRRLAVTGTLAIARHLSTLALALALALGSRTVYDWISGFVALPWLGTLLFTLLTLLALEFVDELFLLGAFWFDRKHGLVRFQPLTMMVQASKLAVAGALLGTVLFSPMYGFSDPPWETARWDPSLWYLFSMLRQWGWVGAYRPWFTKGDASIQERVRLLASQAKVKPPRVTEVDLTARPVVLAPYVVGTFFNRIVISKSLRERLSPEELDCILARELAHKRQARLLVLPILVWILFASPVLWFGLPWIAALFGLGPTAVESLPLFIILCEGMRFVSAPFTNALSRWVERRVDWTALNIVGQPDAFQRAIVKMYDQNLICATPGRVWQLLFGTHPTGVERVQLALRWAQRHQR